MSGKKEKKEYLCEECGIKIPQQTAKSCEAYPIFEGKTYCKNHKEEILRKNGYECSCGTLVTEKAREFSMDRYGKVLCYKCQKQEDDDDGDVVEAIKLPSVQHQTESLIVRPAMHPDDALAAWKEFLDLKIRVKTPKDIIIIRNVEYLKKSFWRKMATFFNLTDEIITREIEADQKGNTKSAYYEVKVIHPNGRSVVGAGFCSANERNFAHPDHDIRAVAHTRAKNRAISDMIGGGEVTAEEMSNALE